MKLTVRESSVPPLPGQGKQHIIERNYLEIPEGSVWAEEYVSFSGFFGKLGPHVFAVAPELLALLEKIVEGLDFDGQVMTRDQAEARALVKRAKVGAA